MLSDIWAIHNILLRVFFFLSFIYIPVTEQLCWDNGHYLRSSWTNLFTRSVTDCLLNLFLKTSIDLLIRKKSIQQISFIHSFSPAVWWNGRKLRRFTGVKLDISTVGPKTLTRNLLLRKTTVRISRGLIDIINTGTKYNNGPSRELSRLYLRADIYTFWYKLGDNDLY